MDIHLISILAGKQTAESVQQTLKQPDFIDLIHRFLYAQRHPESNIEHISLDDLPAFHEKVTLYPSAVATFYAPSDISGTGGMHCEYIRATSDWGKKHERQYDCIFVNSDPSASGMHGLEVAHVRQFFSFKLAGVTYPCALVQWYSRVADEPDEDTGMWIVEPDFYPDGSQVMEVIHLDSVVRAAHLLGVCDDFVPADISHCDSLDTFASFFVNKFADHHAFAIAF